MQQHPNHDREHLKQRARAIARAVCKTLDVVIISASSQEIQLPLWVCEPRARETAKQRAQSDKLQEGLHHNSAASKHLPRKTVADITSPRSIPTVTRHRNDAAPPCS
jgi:hypothetical protein